MKIRADKEGLDIIRQLTDLALKSGGIGNLQVANAILVNCELIEEKVKEEEEAK